MSEADQPNNQSLPETTVPNNDDSALELSEVTQPVENLQIVKFSELPDQKPPVQPWKPAQTDESDSEAAAFLTIHREADDSVAVSADDAGQKSSQDADWFALAQKMRQRNRSLIEQVNQLKGALKQQQEALKSEKTRSQQQETLLAQQTEEFNTLHEQLARLFNALESSHQASVRQQILIETLSEQLQSGQERIAQLERECSYTQQRYNEQSHQLLQAGNTCRDLRSRLQRQQQQTLQFKAALEKSLEMPKASDTQPPQRGFVPKAQPIQAWSAETDVVEEFSDFETIWQHPVRLEPPLPPIQFSKTEPFVVKRLEELDFPAVPETSNLAPTVFQPPEVITNSEETTTTELELESQLLAEMSSLAQAAGLTEVSSNFTEKPESFDESTHRINAQETLLPEEIRVLKHPAQFLDDEIWGNVTSFEPTEPEVVLPQSNWPSPVLYPLRPPKKRKSLAAIELPSFPRFYPT
jgi:hypothetical protein